MNILKCTQFGNPILRDIAYPVAKDRIMAPQTQELIANMRYTLEHKQRGVGLAAPQVGESLALSVVRIRSLPHRPELEPLDLVIINPHISEYIGEPEPKWEGCVSSAPTVQGGLFAKVPRHSKIVVSYYDEHAQFIEKEYEGLAAHVIQHEVDHLNGILFVDRVEDTSTYLTYSEYQNQIVKPLKKRQAKAGVA
jgi:peptide deformylase